MASAIQFPKEIGPASRESYEDTYEESRSETPMEIGPPRRRNLYSVTPRLFTVSWKMTPKQYAVFELWWQESISAGVKEFDIQVLDRTEALRWFTCTVVEGKFTATITTDGQKWTVSAKLRSLHPSFAVRLPLTDQLSGRASFMFKPSAFLPKPVILRGRARFGLSVRRALLNRGNVGGRAVFGIKRASGELGE